jgi:hypothetical protein
MVGDNYRSSFDTAGMRWGFPPCHRHRLCPNTVGAHASCLLLHISAEMQRPTSLGERAKQTQAAPSTPSSPKHGSLEVLGKLCLAATKRHPERHDAAAHTRTQRPSIFASCIQVPRDNASSAPSASHPPPPSTASPRTCARQQPSIPRRTGGQPRSSFHGDSELLAPSSSSHRGAG